MQRKVSVKKYLIAFILTLIIFAGGITIGIWIEDVRLGYSEQVILSEKVNLRSLQLQQNYIDSGLADCNTLNQILENNINDLGKKMAELINYEKRSVFNQDEFNLQLQDYFLTEIQFMLLSQEVDQKCAKDSVKIIYFYDESAHDTQGDILDYLKKLFKEKIMVFSFNSAFKQEPMIGILLSSHGIKQFPSVVVEDQVFQDHQAVEELMEAICNQFTDLPEQCQEFKDGENLLQSKIIEP
ncbi:MAG: hypothetical protein KKH52_00880 [Nanoarchaeota archaeon]|nr:hypothetical protein [Nanoarchaeota archaeon]MBU1623112.1 hypothetical protein [Nanoarchaeota archaeon]MBU1973930.1 hypothetical protein [Nanoarchaeota archaeon]